MRPHTIIATFCRMMDTPMAVISAASRGARRKGRYATRSAVQPTAMHRGTETSRPAPRTAKAEVDGSPPTRAAATMVAAIAPIMTTSPCAKLIRPMMPYTIV
ncbi:Uncharacterised protein [Bordetella pertussis]|nr:Uncharacterised protein [Bordetella pertussis]